MKDRREERTCLRERKLTFAIVAGTWQRKLWEILPLFLKIAFSLSIVNFNLPTLCLMTIQSLEFGAFSARVKEQTNESDAGALQIYARNEPQFETLLPQ